MYNLHINEYLIARNQSYEVIEIAKWTNDGLVRIKSDGKIIILKPNILANSEMNISIVLWTAC